METPSSTRRVTRSQTLSSATSNNNIPISRKIEESEKGVSKSRQRSVNQQDRSALIDITNDSPIVGVAMGSLTPSSAMSKKKSNSTPGSGEALLRGQVKTLLQRVEEEAQLSKLSLDHRPFIHLKAHASSPMGLLAPTPANTPQVLSASSNGDSFKNNCLALVTPSPIQEQLMNSQMVTGISEDKEEGLESEKSMITRSLLLDFSDKSESSDLSKCSSVLTFITGESASMEKTNTEDDSASVWSMQVNASTRDDEEEDDNEAIEEEEEEGYDDYEDEEEEDYDGDLVDELCEGISKINVNGGKHTRFVYDSDGELVGVEEEECGGEKKEMGNFGGKHIKFVYDSDGELVGEEECGGESEDGLAVSSPSMVGKHLRFSEAFEEEEH